MPRYLRWIAAITTGITVQLIFQILFLATIVGTGRKELSGASGAMVTFGAIVVNLVAALAVNDWLAARYPVAKKTPDRV